MATVCPHGHLGYLGAIQWKSLDDGGHHLRRGHGDDEGCIVRSLSALFAVAAVAAVPSGVHLFGVDVIIHALAIGIEDRGRTDSETPSDAGGLQLHGEMAALVLVISHASVELHHFGITSSTVHIYLQMSAVLSTAIVDSITDAFAQCLCTRLCVFLVEVPDKTEDFEFTLLHLLLCHKMASYVL